MSEKAKKLLHKSCIQIGLQHAFILRPQTAASGYKNVICKSRGNTTLNIISSLLLVFNFRFFGSLWLAFLRKMIDANQVIKKLQCT
mgnify:CR=1 FL=1